MNNYFFPNGCPCGGTVEIIKEHHIYKCCSCGNFVTYHKEDTDKCKMYEPQGYLADSEINVLRKNLKEALYKFWCGRVTLVDGNGNKFITPINEIYPKYLIKVLFAGEYEFGLPVSRNGDYTNVFLLDLDKHMMFEFKELEQIQNREKTHVWLAEELGIKAKEFKVGFLDKEQLLRAIEICHEQQRNINARIVRDSKYYEQSEGSYRVTSRGE